jgi:hypothetical protein
MSEIEQAEEIWRGSVQSHLLDYAKKHPRFTAEDAWVYIDAIVEPPNPKVKGPMFKKTLIDEGHVMNVGSAKATNKQAHGRLVTVWKSMLCRDVDEVATIQAQLLDLKKAVHLRKMDILSALKKAYELGKGGGHT